mmetsp:Transcript_5301/g.6683  ORF Transcript_5301/g.6683 Transcript_5301/m.6683 type:complete len:142 (-) Transcript_5301:900-1325(-)|eukprot:CAMPEP_0204841294 /NCGR_PEP_ID=MMETSP1346-20131115/41370_1 /ASSEMBLY_ACC=CAM_ASM_000771 /TAXON_ID=215587 /ORGANISM="Aplanochytrium stocchinoi, Strain GSBS06" /LENGTH=141 /DNA_ID=CAMNT_0051979325 /DNA_START=268 /DNA_END=693 /DNA_ORIENTATION=-
MEEIKKYQEDVSRALKDVEAQLFELEHKYLEITLPYGNIVKGWEGYIDSKPRSSVPGHKRERKIKPSERIFSITSATSPIPNEDIEKEERQRNTPSPTLKRNQSVIDDGDTGSTRGNDKRTGRGARKKKRKRKTGIDEDYR